jgi:basic membrane lipoprotein Med (substrate-binding protein (PBP1-ABC) superfamily)
MQLNVDLAGFNEFGAAADELSKLFNSFIVKLQTVSIIDDLNFLKTIASALEKIVKLSDVFGEFKQTILATAAVKFPKSSHDATLMVQNVMSEVNCAMTYIGHFVNPQPGDPTTANLSAKDANVISQAVKTIENWHVLCEQGVTIAMSNDPNVQYLSTASSQLKANTTFLTHNTSTLRGKLAMYNILQ